MKKKPAGSRYMAGRPAAPAEDLISKRGKIEKGMKAAGRLISNWKKMEKSMKKKPAGDRYGARRPATAGSRQGNSRMNIVISTDLCYLFSDGAECCIIHKRKEADMLEQVIRIAREAAVFMRSRDFLIENKGSVGNDVTSADKQVQKYVKDRLCRLDPSIGFIGEEEGEQDYEARRAWVVDPIDGTANFIRGLNASAISIGLVEDGEATLGVVYNPYQDELYSAQKGKGAFLNGKPIRVSERDFAHGICCTAFCLYRKELSGICQDILADIYAECEDFRRMGTAAIELTALAAGKVEMYFEIRLYPWDYAASACIIKEAGGYVGSISHGMGGAEDDALIYTAPGPVIAANNKENYERIMAIVRRHMS